MNIDQALWNNLKNGDESALRKIYDLYAIKLYRYGCKFTQDSMLAEDCLHDLFLNIWNNRSGLGNTNSIMGYLCLSLRREIIRRLAKPEMSDAEISENLSFNATLSHEDDIIESESQKELKNKLTWVFDQLSDRQKEAIYLRYYEEMEYEQICVVMNINYQSVRNLISRALHQVRELWTLMLMCVVNDKLWQLHEYKSMILYFN